MQLGWWMSLVQVIDLFENLKALLETQRRRLHSGHFGRIGGFRDDDQPMTEVMEVVTYLKNGGSAGVGRFLLDSGPTSDDKVTRLRGQLSKSDDLFPSAADELVIIYQTLQVFFVHLRNHILTLAIAAGLLVLAVNSYPYTSLAWLRLLTTGGMLTIALLVCWFYAQLERDEFLSFLLGSTPDQIEWNWPMLQRLGFLVSIALMTLLFQVFPESGRWLGGLLGPALSLGK